VPLLTMLISTAVFFALQPMVGWDGGRLFVARAITVAIAGTVVFAWMVWLPWWSRAVRRGLAIAPLVAIMLGVGLVRVRGLSGNLVPILAWRWSADSADVSNVAANGNTADVDLTTTSADDYPQFLGPRRDAALPDVELSGDWHARPPKLLWKRPIGAGWSAFAVVGPFAVTQEQLGEQESVVCYRVLTGEVCWVHGDPIDYESVVAGSGPRATPTIVGGRVYTVGATGLLNCLDGATGKLIWQRHTLEDNHAQPNEWGASCSPLVTDGLVVVSPGGTDGRSLVAYDADSGEPVWHGGDDLSGYSSPTLANLAGVKQVLIVNGLSVTGHDLRDGRLLWDYRWGYGEPNVSQPVPIDENRVLISSGYGVGAALLEIVPVDDGQFAVRTIWKSLNLKSKFSNVVLRDGFIYGLDDPGILACVELKTGRRKWKRGRYGHGQIMLVGRTILVQAENGDLALVEATPNRPHELARIPALDDKTWNNPALAGNHLLIRNDQQAACYEVELTSRDADDEKHS